MRVAHQGIAVAALPGAGIRPGSAISTIAQTSPGSDVAQYNTPMPPANVGGRAPPPPRGAVRPEAASGLDGWLMDRLFGR
jgi:penicillin-binding protein 1A